MTQLTAPSTAAHVAPSLDASRSAAHQLVRQMEAQYPDAIFARKSLAEEIANFEHATAIGNVPESVRVPALAAILALRLRQAQNMYTGTPEAAYAATITAHWLRAIMTMATASQH